MVGDLEVYSLEEVIDEMIGPVGTPERQEFDEQVQRDEEAFLKKEALKQRQNNLPHTKRVCRQPKSLVITRPRRQLTLA